jgi:hypothetical protein
MTSKHTDQSNTWGQRQSNSNNNSSKHENKKASTNASDNSSEPSLWTKVQSSASTLIQDTISRPSGAAADLAQALNNSNGKGSSYSSSLSSSSLPGLSASSGLWSSSSSYPEAEAKIGDTFRSVAATKPDLEPVFEESFQHSHHHDYGEDYDANSLQKGKGKHIDLSISQTGLDDMTNMHHYFNEYEMAWINATRSDRPTSLSARVVTQQGPSIIQPGYIHEEKDGAAVVTLLSNPSFQPGLIDDAPFDAWDVDDSTDADGYPAVMSILTADEKEILDSFRRQSELEHGHSTTGASSRITGKSLIPDIDTFIAENEYSAQLDIREAVLSQLPGAEDWVGVEERYHEEVWGYLRPALEDAARELEEEKKEDGELAKAKDGPAVRRLKMILRHMRGAD